MKTALTSNQLPVAPQSGGLTAEQQNQGMRYATFVSCLTSPFTLLFTNSAIGALLIKELGGSDFEAMIPASFLVLSNVLQIPASLIVSPRKGKAFMSRCWRASILIWAFCIFIPSVTGHGSNSVWPFLATLTAAFAISNCGSAFWFAILHDVIPPGYRGRFFGGLRALWNSAGLLIIFLSGLYIGDRPTILKFQIVLVIALALRALGVYMLEKIPIGRSLSGEHEYTDWKRYIRDLFRHKQLVVFMVYYCTLGFCFGFLGQPLVLYMKYMGFPAKENIFIFGSGIIGTILSLLAAGYLVDYLGTKKVFLTAHLVMCAACFAVAGITRLPIEQTRILLPVVLVISGAMIATSGVACTAQLFHLAPDRGRAFYLCLSQISIGMGPAISALLAGQLVGSIGYGWIGRVFDVPYDIYQMLIMSAGILMLLAIVMLKMIDNVKPAEKIVVV